MDTKKILIEASPAKRSELCKDSFRLFVQYYFSHFFKYQTALFHRKMYLDLEDLLDAEINEILWIMFRESAKTSIAKMFVVYCICYNFKDYINWDSYDKGNAEAALFDITIWLQSNKKIIQDFGQLYNQGRSQDIKTMKRVSNFITTNDIRVEAYSTQESTRGRIFGDKRPDLFVVDDFETFKTRDSYAITHKIRQHIDEMRAGLGVTGSVIFLANYITEEGNVAALMEEAKANVMMRVRNIPVVLKNEIQWPDKYVMTNIEAEKLNRNIEDKERRKVSLEAKKVSLTPRVFDVEMMNNPERSDDLVFDRDIVDNAIAVAQSKEYNEIAGLKIWKPFNAKHRYGGGADTSEGVGLDSNADVIFNFTRRPNLVVATYENNKIAPDVFAHELKRHGDKFGECLMAVESNNTGFATLTEFKKIYPLLSIFKRKVKDKTGERATEQLGFRTTVGNKTDIIYQFKSGFEDGEFEIWDVGLLMEMRHYKLRDLQSLKYEEGMTRHFDKLMAAAIGWEMRNYAKIPPKKKKARVNAPKPPLSEYEVR